MQIKFNPAVLIPGYGLAICYTIFSIWGFLTLIIVGLGLNVGYRKIDFDEIPTHDLDAVSVDLYSPFAFY